MVQHVRDAWRTIVPAQGDPHGLLLPMLVLMTAVTGLVDAFSYLELGRVFVANMTGNVVFLAFGLGGAEGFLWWAVLLAVAAFVVGAFGGGRVAFHHGHNKGQQLMVSTSLQLVAVLAAFIVALSLDTDHYSNGSIATLIVLVGLGMGMQNATSRNLAVPDLTTTVLTLTITGISADSVPAGGKGSRLGRRALSVASMFLGALIGALIISSGHGRWVLGVAVVLLAVVVAVSVRIRRDRMETPRRSGPPATASR